MKIDLSRTISDMNGKAITGEGVEPIALGGLIAMWLQQLRSHDEPVRVVAMALRCQEGGVATFDADDLKFLTDAVAKCEVYPWVKGLVLFMLDPDRVKDRADKTRLTAHCATPPNLLEAAAAKGKPNGSGKEAG